MKSHIVSSILLVSAAHAQQTVYGQCGGIGYNGPTTCAGGSYCSYQNPYYSQCLPGSPSTSAAKASPSKTSTTMATVVVTTSTKSTATATSGQVKFAGVNIAGFDFGCGTDGSCNTADTTPPLASLGGADGLGQMQHFVKDDHMNIFRLPVGWQFLQSSPGATLTQSALGKYDQLVQACLSTGAYCIIDIHNYARWNGAIIGQGGPTNAQFANLWSQLATKYASQSKVIFGIMNEPHDIPNISTWATSVQAAVTAIRSAGATSQYILLPGNDYTSAGSFVSDGSGPALLGVKNPDGSITNLIFDVHKYLDSDGSGTNAECTTNNVQVFTSLASWLRSNKRMALLSETGGGNTQSCETDLCQEIAYLNANSDVYLGYVGWAAGSFATSYVLSETPTNNGGSWTDQPLVKDCLAR